MSQNRSEQTQNLSGNSNNNRISIQTRLVLSILFIALTPLIIVSTRNITQTRQALTNGAEISLRSSAVQTANSLDTFIDETLNSIQIEAQFSDFMDYLVLSSSEQPVLVEQAKARDLLEKLSKKDTANVISYALIDADGNVLLDTAQNNIKTNESKEAYFPQVQFSNRPVVTAVTYSDETTTIIQFAGRILNNNGDFIGILRAKYNSAVLQAVINESIGTSTDASVLLLDQLNIRMADTKTLLKS